MSTSRADLPAVRASAIDELPTLWEGFAKLVGAGLGVTAFGANIMDLPPDYSTRPTTRRSPASRSSTSRCAARAPWSSGRSSTRSTRITSWSSTRAPRGCCGPARRAARAVRRRRARRRVRAAGVELEGRVSGATSP